MPSMNRREFALGGLAMTALAGSAPASAMAQAAGQTRDPLWFVAPELRDGARMIQQMWGNRPPLSLATLAEFRKGGGSWAGPPLAEVPVRKLAIPGARGAPDVTIYVVNAKPGMQRGGILHMHGGGFVGGLAENSIRDMQDYATALDCAIVTVEYRLAPETTYAGSIEDNYAGLRWLHAHAGELGVDPARIAVMGESAGGGHAAMLAIVARDRGEVAIAFQCLTYPMLDDRTGSSRAVPPHIGTLVWTRDSNVFGWRSLLGQAPGGKSAPVMAVPARNPNLAGLPPAYIGVGAIDLFVSEDIAYANRLIEAGVPVQLDVVPGAYHGFDIVGADTAPGKNFKAAKMAALRRALSPAA